MEDREIVKNIIKQCEQCKLKECIGCGICWGEVQAMKSLLNENNELKQALLTNKNLYEEVCNKNKQLEEQVEYLRRSCDRKEEVTIETQQECEELCNKNKELEEENRTLKRVNHITEGVTVEDITEAMNKSYEEFMKQFIPASLIKEKIEKNECYLEYANTTYEYTQEDVIQEVIDNLKELLGDEK